MRQNSVVILGAGIAGSEAAWQLAIRGIDVTLYEMRPQRSTEAHKTAGFAELVCSNSFGSDTANSASRILKDEISELGSFVLGEARKHAVPAGNSLAVDRDLFSQSITQQLEQHPRIRIVREERTELPAIGWGIVATGPLTSPALSASLSEAIGGGSLYFYDAISPIVSFESLNLEKMFWGSRWGKGEPDFLNIPLSKEAYLQFVDDLLKGDVVVPKDFEEEKYFEGCMPIEALAARGPMTLAFGPMKPVGLFEPATGRRAYAILQLRTENRYRTAFNLVGFQTKLKYKEQERIFRTLPGLENAEFLRLGSMHRNTFIDSPRVLEPTLQLRARPQIFVAGQLTGTEGYLESAATGLWAGLNLARAVRGDSCLCLPPETMLGALLAAITDSQRAHFQPMNANLGVLPPLESPVRKDKALRNRLYAERSLRSLKAFLTAGESTGLSEDCTSASSIGVAEI